MFRSIEMMEGVEREVLIERINQAKRQVSYLRKKDQTCTE